MEKRNILISLTTIVLVGIVFLVVNQHREKPNTNEVTDENVLSDGTNPYDTNAIEKMKNEMEATADTNLYRIEEEYDGRKILQIKPSVQFETVLTGILKKGQPSEEEIQNILEKKPEQKGIWVAQQARGKFLEQLKASNLNEYAINEEGYLKYTEKKEEPKAKILNTAIDSEKLYIINIEGLSYIRDEFTGKIVEYPFEKMDPYQIIDTYQNGNQIILQVTTNQQEKLSKQEILEEILLNLE